MISLVIFSSQSLFCVCVCVSRFSCAFYLTNIYCKVVCCSPIPVPTRFFYQRVHGPNPLVSFAHYASSPHSFCLFAFSSFFAFDVNTRRTLPLPLSHSPFHLPCNCTLSTTPRRCVLCRSRLLPSVCLYGLPAPLNLCASNNNFVLFFLSRCHTNKS